jgi:hypothetical protein
MRSRLSFAILITVLFSIFPRPTAAQICSQLTWGETKTRAFVFTYQESTSLGEEIAGQFGSALDEEFNRFSNLFGTTLPVPVMVRIYPTERDYYCFNALAPEIPIGQTHSHIGGREIALIAQNILDHNENWQRIGLDALRGELAILFLNLLSADNAPPGLILGTGVYAQDPFIAIDTLLKTTAPPYEQPSTSWRSLWEAPDRIGSPDHAVQAASITAYLVDVYGWENFTEFANNLRTAESWRFALETVYPASANALEDQWATTYYPRFMSGRWRENALYTLSLTPYEQLVASGAYQAAVDGLENVMSLLIDLEDFDRLAQAEALNATAYRGLQADALARQSRQAYLEGDFDAAKSFSAEAIQKYIALSDLRNLESLLIIEKQSEEIIELHKELDSIQTKTPSLNAGPRLNEIGARFQQLGDTSGAQRADDAITNLNALKQRIAFTIAIAGSILAMIIVFFRLKRIKDLPPPEVQLQS